MRWLGLDCDLGVDAIDVFSFSSNVSVYDYDVVLWDPASSLEEYLAYSTVYNGLPSLNETKSAQLRNDTARRRAEFLEFIQLGRVLVVFLPGETGVYIDTGKREYSGTGRNRAT